MSFLNYQLGIIFSIGYYEPTENKFIIHHKDKFQFCLFDSINKISILSSQQVDY